MNEPPLHTALFKAAYLLSEGGTKVPIYFLTNSGYFFTAVSVSQKITPKSSNSFSYYDKLLLIQIE